MAPQHAPFVCFACRKSFKRAAGRIAPPCPDCGGATVELDPAFDAPHRRDEQAWRVVRYLVARGFRYAPIPERDEQGAWVRYPRTLARARAFARRYAHHARGRGA